MGGARLFYPLLHVERRCYPCKDRQAMTFQIRVLVLIAGAPSGGIVSGLQPLGTEEYIKNNCHGPLAGNKHPFG